MPALALTISIALLTSACSGPGTEIGAVGDPTQSGVAYGATLEEYQAAFEDVEPVTLRFQIESAEGSFSARAREAYLDAVEEWSGEKIQFDVGYSSSFVPAATEWAGALADGRLDGTMFLPYYTPEVFPAINGMIDASFIDGTTPTSTLIAAAWQSEIAAEQVYQDEAEANGIHMMAAMPNLALPGTFCDDARTTLSDFDGQPVSVSGVGRVAQMESLGMTPTSIAFTELYEALERGILTCATTVVGVLDTTGITPLVPHLILDPQAGLTGFTSFLAFGQETWDSLPLVAQQLLFDRQDVLLAAEPPARGQQVADVFAAADAAGGGPIELAQDARSAMLEANARLLNELRADGADVDGFVAASERWGALVNDELGYGMLSTDLDEFFAAGGYTDVDLQPYVEAFFDEILLAERPR